MEERKSSEEQREEMKKQFLEDLKAKKQIIEKVKDQSILKKIEREVEKLMGLGSEDDTQTWIDTLNAKSGKIEAAFDDQILPQKDTLSTETPIDKLNEENPDTIVNSKTLGDHEQIINQPKETGSLKDTPAQNDKTLF
ncbi:MAG: hypothetical protein LC115_03785 [Bacteroidia bacterium]|nr:hypothetical protein [Bacteroidia bacterium]